MKDLFFACLIWLMIVFGALAIWEGTQPRVTITYGDDGNSIVYHNIDPDDVNKYINN